MKAREHKSELIEQLINETTPEEMERIDKEMSKQQTAVEWLVEQVNSDCLNSAFIRPDLIKEAMQMEKKKIKDAHHNGFTEGTCFGAAYMYRYTTSEEYYNETYGELDE